MPELSIIIPTYNRSRQLGACLQALARQSAAPDRYEVVVVDDGSRDDTQAVLRHFDARFELRFEYQENQGEAAARNRALQLAQAPICLFIDDDILAEPGLVEAHITAHAAGPVVGIGRLSLVMAHRRLGGLLRQFERTWNAHYAALENGTSQPTFWDCYSGNLSVPTAVTRQVGGFDASLPRSCDVELGLRLERAGLPIVYIADAAAAQRYDKDLPALLRDFDAAGRASVALWRRYPELARFAPFGDFGQTGRWALLLRRLLLALRAPTWPLRWLDPLLARRSSLRLYRFVQLHCFWRSVRAALPDRATWKQLTRGPVILMYHAVGGRGEPASRYVIPRRRLALQLAWLRLRRRPVLTLDHYADQHEAAQLAPAGAVLITFDDGYRDNFTRALPLLQRFGLRAAFFVVTGRVGDANRWNDEPPLAGRPLLSWDHVRALRRAGMEVGSHTVSHASLPTMQPAAAARELRDSRAALAGELGEEIAHFAFPYGDRSPALEEAVRQAGYRTALAITPGPNGPAVPRHALRRLEVHGDRSFARFVLELWLGAPLRR